MAWFECRACRKRGRVPEKYLGKMVRCPQCKQPVRVVAEPAAAGHPPEAPQVVPLPPTQPRVSPPPALPPAAPTPPVETASARPARAKRVSRDAATHRLVLLVAVGVALVVAVGIILPQLPEPKTAASADILLAEIDAAANLVGGSSRAGRNVPLRMPRPEYVSRLSAIGRPAAEPLARCALGRNYQDYTGKIAQDALIRMGSDCVPAVVAYSATIKCRPWKDDLVFRTAVSVINRIGPSAAPALVEVLTSQRPPAQRALAARYLGELSASPRLPERDPITRRYYYRPKVYCRARYTSSRWPEAAKEAIPALLITAEDGDEEVRYCAKISLAIIAGATEQTAGHVLDLFSGEDDEIAKLAYQQLLLSRGLSAKWALRIVELLKPSDHQALYVRYIGERRGRLARILGVMGPAVNPIVPALLDAVDKEPALVGPLREGMAQSRLAAKEGTTPGVFAAPASEIPRLRKWLRTGDPNKGLLAAELARAAGPAAKELLPDLYFYLARLDVASPDYRLIMAAAVAQAPSFQVHVPMVANVWQKLHVCARQAAGKTLEKIATSPLEQKYLRIMGVRCAGLPAPTRGDLESLGPNDAVVLPFLEANLRRTRHWREPLTDAIADAIVRIDPEAEVSVPKLLTEGHLHEDIRTLLLRYDQALAVKIVEEHLRSTTPDKEAWSVFLLELDPESQAGVDAVVANLKAGLMRSSPYDKAFPTIKEPARTRLGLALASKLKADSGATAELRRAVVKYLALLGVRHPTIARALQAYGTVAPYHGDRLASLYWRAVLESAAPEEINWEFVEAMFASRRVAPGMLATRAQAAHLTDRIVPILLAAYDRREKGSKIDIISALSTLSATSPELTIPALEAVEQKEMARPDSRWRQSLLGRVREALKVARRQAEEKEKKESQGQEGG